MNDFKSPRDRKSTLIASTKTETELGIGSPVDPKDAIMQRAKRPRLWFILSLTVTLAAALLVSPLPAAAVSDRAITDHSAPTTATGVTVSPEINYEWYKWVLHLHRGNCYDYEVCLWSANHYTGVGLKMGGDLSPCEGFRFEGTFMQDHVYSIWTRASGPISIWNRFSDGSYRYHKYALLQPGYSHDTEFTKIMDAWVYDPNNNCTSLHLHKVVHPE